MPTLATNISNFKYSEWEINKTLCFCSAGSVFGQCGIEQRPKISEPRLGPDPFRRRQRKPGPKHEILPLPTSRLVQTSGQDEISGKHLDGRRSLLHHVQRESLQPPDSSQETSASPTSSRPLPPTTLVQTASSPSTNLRHCQTDAGHRLGERKLRLITAILQGDQYGDFSQLGLFIFKDKTPCILHTVAQLNFLIVLPLAQFE